MRSHLEQQAFFLDLERKLADMEFHTKNVNTLTTNIQILVNYLIVAKELAGKLAETYKGDVMKEETRRGYEGMLEFYEDYYAVMKGRNPDIDRIILKRIEMFKSILNEGGNDEEGLLPEVPSD